MTGRPVAICVPARNEADRLPLLVRSLAGQRGSMLRPPLRVLVVANNCTDDTVPALHALKCELHGSLLALDVVDVRLEGGEAHVGVARRLAMDRGAAWLERDGAADGVLLTTDADAIAPPDWVAGNLTALDHAELVGGRLCIDDAAGDERLARLNGRIEQYWAAVRALEQVIDAPPYDPDPRHGDHTGASLALAVSLYRQAGGLPPLACGEDNALVTRVRCLGGRVRHCPSVSITVSARRVGRVTGGMASEMDRRAAIVAGEHAYEVPPPAHWQGLLEQRLACRRAWQAFATGPQPERAFASLGLDADDLAAIAPTTCSNDIAFVERAMLRDSRWTTSRSLIDLDRALADFEAVLDRSATTPRHAIP